MFFSTLTWVLAVSPVLFDAFCVPAILGTQRKKQTRAASDGYIVAISAVVWFVSKSKKSRPL